MGAIKYCKKTTTAGSNESRPSACLSRAASALGDRGRTNDGLVAALASASAGRSGVGAVDSATRVCLPGRGCCNESPLLTFWKGTKRVHGHINEVLQIAEQLRLEHRSETSKGATRIQFGVE